MGNTPAKRVENAVADTTARVITAVGDAITGSKKPARRKQTKTRPAARKPAPKTRKGR